MDTMKSATEAIKAHVSATLSDEIKRLISLANHDLYFGPIPEGAANDDGDDGPLYPGFCEACKRIGEAFEECDELWYDSACGTVSADEPETWADEDTGEVIEPCWEDYYKFDRQAIRLAVLGRELSSSVR